MSNRSRPRGLITHTFMETRVEGLRDYQPPPEVKVFSATTGKLLRIEEPKIFFQTINPRRIRI